MIAHAHREVKAATRPAIPFQFRAEPVGIRESKLVSQTAASLFTVVLDDAKRRGWRCRLGNAALGARIGRTAMTVKRCLAELEAAGLVARDMAAGGRVRLGIVVTWDGVEHSRSSDGCSVEHSRATGGPSAAQGVEHSRSTSQSSPDRKSSGGIFPSRGGEEIPDEKNRLLTPAEAAAGLRAILAGKWSPAMFDGEVQPAEPIPPAPPAVVARPIEAPAPPAVVAVSTPLHPSRPASVPPAKPGAVRPQPLTPRPASPVDVRNADVVDPVEARRLIERMAGRIGVHPQSDVGARREGRRKTSPRELQRQLAEVRRKYGGRKPSGGS